MADSPPGLVTRTSFNVPGGRAGSFAEICVGFTATPPAVRPPTRTVAPDWKFAPEIVSGEPAAGGPESGVRPWIMGCAGVGVGPLGVGVRVGVRVAVGGTGVKVFVGVRVGVEVRVSAGSASGGVASRR